VVAATAIHFGCGLANSIICSEHQIAILKYSQPAKHQKLITNENN